MMNATFSTLQSTSTPKRRRFTVDEYHQLIDAGIFAPTERVELILGELVPKMTLNPPHGTVVSYLTRLFASLLTSDQYHLRIQNPITLSRSEPEPDLTVVVGQIGRYSQKHPNASDVKFLIEVSDTSLQYDQTEKLSMYAAEEIQEYWVINIPERQVECYSNPKMQNEHYIYTNKKIYLESDTVEIRIDDVLLGTFIVGSILP